MRNTPKIIELIITILIIVIVNLFSYLFQSPITNNDGKGMDGVEYYKVAEDFVNNKTPEAKAPFVYRIGTPYLVSFFFENDLLNGFKTINIIAGSFIPIMLLFWISLFYNSSFLRILPVVLFSLTWHSPLRLSWYYPVHSDPIAVLILLKLLFLLYLVSKDESKYIIFNQNLLQISFILLTFIGVFFREICVIPAFIFSLKAINFDITNLKSFKFDNFKRIQYIYLIPLIFGIFGIIITHILVNPIGSYSFLGALGLWIYQKSIVMNFHALIIAFGPIIYIIFFTYLDAWNFLKKEKDLLVFLIIILFLSFAGGSDTERIIYWSFPIVYLLIINSIIKNKEKVVNILFLSIITLGQIINMRIFLTTPDYPNNYSSVLPILTPIANKFPFLDLFTMHGYWKVNVLSFFEYIILMIIAYFIFNYIKINNINTTN